MTWFAGLAIYFIIWWVVLFMVLPFGLEKDESPQVGNTTSAPANPKIFKKFMWTTIISAVVFLIIYGLMQMHLIDFYGISTEWMKEDQGK